MDTAAATTMMKILESLPDQLQEDVVEHMRDYVEDIRDETKWKELFSRTKDRLIAADPSRRPFPWPAVASPVSQALAQSHEAVRDHPDLVVRSYVNPVGDSA